MKLLLTDFSKSELAELPIICGQPKYRVEQIYRWLTAGKRIEDMTNLPKPLRTALSAEYSDMGMRIIKTAVSRDGTKKFLFEAGD